MRHVAVSRESPISFTALRILVDLDAEISDEQRARLLKPADRYCASSRRRFSIRQPWNSSSAIGLRQPEPRVARFQPNNSPDPFAWQPGREEVAQSGSASGSGGARVRAVAGWLIHERASQSHRGP